MIHLELLGVHTRLLSPLCARCPQGAAGCCFSPPLADWSDIGRIVLLGGRDFLLAQIAAGRLSPVAGGLRLLRVRRRERPTDRRQNKCVFHGAEGCTIDHTLRPATCNYYVCEDTFREGEGDDAQPEDLRLAASAAARRAHAALHTLYSRWDQVLAARIAAAWPEGVAWDAAFLDWLGDELRLLEARAAPFEALSPVSDERPSRPATEPR
ncbi:hypothetical protein [Chondromyces crocatus]|uniref:Zinc/iron-chelating domain-containing protein n=1 Tax=Chondromyces crocatus TaxID=52 RepID=A0A0K1E620_CHOCO|nr:hypothetical protein [Chondromyces crocatus]AKT36122.1 uncharacterized protein CMC5_002350 [Chondromyces crocatus]